MEKEKQFKKKPNPLFRCTRKSAQVGAEVEFTEMARKKSKQAGVGNKEQSLSKSPGGGGDAGAAAAARSTQVALAQPANQANSNMGRIPNNLLLDL